jgi:glutamyl-tRNA reductase
VIVVVGLSHRTAPVEVRERLAIPRDQMSDALARIVARPGVGEAMCVSTCNRVEVLVTPEGKVPLDEVAATVATILDEMATELGGDSVRAHLYRHVGSDAVRHLFRVTSSLDSIVIGEPQILGQMKDAFEAAQAAGTIGPTLSRAVTRALHTAKRVRTETQIGEGLVSVSSVAVDLAAQIFGKLQGRTAMLIGAGEMAEAAAQLLAKDGAKVVVVNRSPERASELAARVGGVPRPWDDLVPALVDADVVISSTSSRGYVLTHDTVARAMKTRKGRTLFVIDIAVPRDVEPTVNSIDNVFRYDVDDLEGIVQESMRGRQNAAAKAESLVADEARSLDAWAEARGVTPTIVALRQKTKSVLAAELDRSLSTKLKHLGESDRAALEAMLEATVNKLLHSPTQHLRKAAGDPRGEQLAQVIRDLFELPDVAVIEEQVKESARKK